MTYRESYIIQYLRVTGVASNELTDADVLELVPAKCMLAAMGFQRNICTIAFEEVRATTVTEWSLKCHVAIMTAGDEEEDPDYAR